MKSFLPILVIVAIVLGFWGRLFFPDPKLVYTVEIIGSDIWNTYFPIKHFLSESLKRGEIPFWASGMGTGFPVQAEGQVGTFYLPNLILYWLLPTWLAWNLNLVLVFFLGFLGSYFFFKKIGLSTIASLASGFSFSFGGYFISRVIHMAPLQTASLMPWIFLAGEYLWEKPTAWRGLLLSFVISQQIAAGHLQWVMITLLGFVLYSGLHLFEKRRGGNWQGAVWVGAAMVLGIAVAAPQLLETGELRQLSGRQAGLTSEEVFVFPYSLRNLVTFVLPEYYGTPRDGTYSGDPSLGLFWENTAYMGILPLLFLVVALVRRNKKPWEWTMIVLGGVSLLLALGRSSPLYFVHTLPIVDSFRVSSRYLLLTTFAVAALAGAGLDQMIMELARKRKGGLVRVLPWLVLALLVLDLGRFSFPYHTLVPLAEALKEPESAKAISGGQRIFSDPRYLTYWKQAYVTDGWQEPAPFLYLTNALYGNLSMVFGRTNIRPLAGLATRRQAAAGEVSRELLDANATQFIVSPSQTDGEGELVRTVLPPTSSLPAIFVLQNPDRLDRIRFVSGYDVVHDLEEAVALARSGFDFRRSVILEADPGWKFTVPRQTEVRIVEDRDRRLVLATRTDTQTILVVADSYYPAWQARIDGEPAEILPANIDQRAVVVPAGEHEIVMGYEPRSFYRGMWVALVAIGAFVLGSLVALRGSAR